jgi:hypothetical protein
MVSAGINYRETYFEFPELTKLQGEPNADAFFKRVTERYEHELICPITPESPDPLPRLLLIDPSKGVQEMDVGAKSISFCGGKRPYTFHGYLQC